MKYFIAFKKEKNREESFVLIPNNLIYFSLDVNNNLSALCSFTGRFDDEKELKAAIIKLIPAFKIYADDNLVIAWRRGKAVQDIKYNSIIYKNIAGYLNYDSLVDLLVSKAYEPFFDAFFSHYQGHNYLTRELYALYATVKRRDSYDVIVARVKLFLNKALFGKSGLEYAKLYKMVVFISSALGFDCPILDREGVNEASNIKCLPLSEAQEFELEWLEDRARLRQLNQW